MEPEQGTCDKSGAEEEQVFIAEYCPSDYSPMVLIGLCLYLVSFQSGLGPVPWIVNAEASASGYNNDLNSEVICTDLSSLVP